MQEIELPEFNSSDDDHNHMRHALALALRGQGFCAPNPSVGCVIVKKGRVVGRGRTGNGGRPHAEQVALDQAKYEAKGASVFVTLEPCAHHAKTPPCGEALVKAEVRRVVIGCLDPDPRVSGKGVEILKNAGMEVETGVLEQDAQEVHHGFLTRITKNRPAITLKIATSADGKIAQAKGKNTQITGDLARLHVHNLRSRRDAILVGKQTVLTDNPDLTTRLDGISHKLLRVVLDTNLEIPADAKIYNGEAPTLVFHGEGINPAADLENKPDLTFCAIEKTGTGLDLNKMLEVLASRGVNDLLVEGGAHIMTSFLKADLWDSFMWYKAPDITLGDKAVNALIDPDIEKAPAQFNMKHETRINLGQDVLDIYRKPL